MEVGAEAMEALVPLGEREERRRPDEPRAHERQPPPEDKVAEDREKHNPARDLLRPGDTVLGGRWRVLEKIGNGGFGQIYSAEWARETGEVGKETGPGWVSEERRVVAVKTERGDVERESLSTEARVLRELKGRRHFPLLEGAGRETAGEGAERQGLLAMELLSVNLSELRRSLKAQRLSGLSLRRLGLQCLDALRQLHQAGWLHRDVKPSNWALGLRPSELRVIKLIDFGLARRYQDSGGRVKGSRERPGFRGTVRYASLRAHRHEDLGRGDDLVSLSYMLLEMGTGALPWRRLRAKEAVAAAKEGVGAAELGELYRDPLDGSETEPTRRALRRFHSGATAVGFADEPPYARLFAALRHRLPQPALLPPLDWETLHLLRHRL